MTGTKAANKTNVIAIAVIMALVLAGMIAWLLYGQSAAGAASGETAVYVAVVHDSQGNETRLPLDEDATQTISTDLGSNTVVVEDSAVHVEDADCSNHDCIKQGEISTPGQQIICLPHKLWIEVVAEGGVSAGAPSELSSSNEGSDVSGESFDAESR